MSKAVEILKYSNPVIAQQKANKYVNNLQLHLSHMKNKKYFIIHPVTGKQIHFGAMGYEDFTKHGDDARRNLYLKRAKNIKGKWRDDLFSPNNLSIHILW